MRHPRTLFLGLALALAPAAAGAGEVSLEGTWHVIAHYTDSATNNPCSPRWEDRVWVFQREGDRLRWVDYPIVVLSDDRGRFEGRKRVLGYWEPNDGGGGYFYWDARANSRDNGGTVIVPDGRPATGRWRRFVDRRSSRAA